MERSVSSCGEYYYNLLEVDKTASPEEINRAYRKQALKYHPDKNRDDKDAEEKFKEIKQAHDVLSDPEKRLIYDRFGRAGLTSSFEDMVNTLWARMFTDYMNRQAQEQAQTESESTRKTQSKSCGQKCGLATFWIVFLGCGLCTCCYVCCCCFCCCFGTRCCGLLKKDTVHTTQPTASARY